MEWIKTIDKMPDISDEDILMSDGKSIWFGYYGYKGSSESEKRDGAGFIDYASWSDAFGYDSFEDNITDWMPAPKLPCEG